MELPTLAILVTLAHCAAFAAPAFIVNISGEEQRFKFKVAPNGKTHSVTLPPRTVCVK